MNRTPLARRTQIIGALVEGNSIRSTERMTNTHRDTIMRLMVEVGNGCAKLHDEQMRQKRTSRLMPTQWTPNKDEGGMPSTFPPSGSPSAEIPWPIAVSQIALAGRPTLVCGQCEMSQPNHSGPIGRLDNKEQAPPPPG